VSQDVSIAAIWDASLPLDSIAARLIARWCAECSGVPLARLPQLPALRALPSPPPLASALDDGPCLVGAMVVAEGQGIARRGLVIVQPGGIVPCVLGAPGGVVPLVESGSLAVTRPGRGRRSYLDDAAVIVAGLDRALAVAGGCATVGTRRVLAAPDVGSLLELCLPATLHRLVLVAAVDDPSFANETIVQIAAERLRSQGRRAEIAMLRNERDGA
jgi:hypothetical protein